MHCWFFICKAKVMINMKFIQSFVWKCYTAMNIKIFLQCEKYVFVVRCVHRVRSALSLFNYTLALIIFICVGRWWFDWNFTVLPVEWIYRFHHIIFLVCRNVHIGEVFFHHSWRSWHFFVYFLMCKRCI